MENLKCKRCGNKIGIIEIFNVKPNEVYYCKKCNEPQEPEFHPLALKTWDKTPFLGAMTTLIPILVINLFTDNNWVGFVYGGIIGMLFYLLYLLFLVNTTKFK